jgi:hypothetical protein
VDVSSSQSTGYLAGEANVRPPLVRPRATEGVEREGGGPSNLPGTLFGPEGASPRRRSREWRSDLENSITSASIYRSQVTKGLRWMPWRQEPMKDARDCEKLRGAVNEALIRRYPNGETRPGSCPVTQV